MSDMAGGGKEGRGGRIHGVSTATLMQFVIYVEGIRHTSGRDIRLPIL